MGFTDWNQYYDKKTDTYKYKPEFFKTDIKAVAIAKTKCCKRTIVPSEVYEI